MVFWVWIRGVSSLFVVKIVIAHKVIWFQHAPGVPKVLVGNRLHLAFKRQVGTREAEAYAFKNRMSFFEVSPLCDFNIRESFSELSRMALHRNGMERLWRSNKGTVPCDVFSNAPFLIFAFLNHLRKLFPLYWF